jgi:PleD family two-component response regulator
MARRLARRRSDGGAVDRCGLFKPYNDRYGHPMAMAARKTWHSALADLVARYGVEDCVMRLPQTPRRGVERIGRRALDTVDPLDNPHPASLTVRLLTVSTGIASYDDASACWGEPGLPISRSRITCERAVPPEV